MSDAVAPDNTPTSNPIMKKALLWSALVAVAIAVIGATVGGLVAGVPGIAGALLGAALALVFMGITAASILLGNRFAQGEQFVGIFFGIVLGGWLLKLVLFIAVVAILRGQEWFDSVVLFICLVAGVLGSLTVDVIVAARSRMPYVSDAKVPTASSE